MADMRGICDDLEAESADLDVILGGLEEAGWDTPTPAEDWMVRDQVSHLAFFDSTATTAAVDPDLFRRQRDESAADLEAYVKGPVVKGRSMTGAALLAWFREQRAQMVAAFRALDGSTRLPWYGPDMSAASFATARLMETWAHGQDVADALGASRPPTERLRHVAHIGVRALPNSFRAQGRAVPEVPVRVELSAPSGEAWEWGEVGAPDMVRGPALDFCLVVTQRRHPSDTALVTTGAVAAEWMTIAQAFAGPPGSGRHPGQFATSEEVPS